MYQCIIGQLLCSSLVVTDRLTIHAEPKIASTALVKRIAITIVNIEIRGEVLDGPSEFLAGDEANTAKVVCAGVFRIQYQYSVEIIFGAFRIVLPLICKSPPEGNCRFI